MRKVLRIVLGSAGMALLAALPASAGATTPGSSPGQLYAFGYNFSGQLGNATNDTTSNPNPTPVLVSLPGATGPVTQVASGFAHSLAVTSTGQLYAFGENFLGELGSTTNNNTSTPNPAPTPVTLLGATGRVVQVAAGIYDSLAVTSTGQLYAFGENRYGELGSATNNGTGKPNPVPTQVTLPGAQGGVVQVAAGLFFSLAVTSSGQLYSFGNNNEGQLGTATNEGVNGPNLPSQVNIPGRAVRVATGADYSLVINSAGQLYAFGHNAFGQLGFAANSTPNPTPTPVTLPGASGPVVQAAAGSGSSLAVTSAGQVFAFGNNAFGQLGFTANSNPNPTPTPVTLPGATGPVVHVAAGWSHSLAITSTGQLFAFGDNLYGQLASNVTNTPHSVPTLVGLPGAATSDTVALGPAAYQTLVVVADLGVATTSLRGGVAGASYNAAVQASGGTAPYAWSASGLPPGLSINPSSGAISGTPGRLGTYTTTVTLTDADQITTSRQLTLAVAAPTASRLRVRGSTAGRIVSGHCVAATRRNARHPACVRRLKLTIKFDLNGAATVALRLQRPSVGRLVKGRCVALRRANAKHHACTRFTALPGRVTRHAHLGANTVTLSGRFAGHTLAPGTYRLTVTPSVPGGTGKPRTITFTIVP